MWSLLMMMVWLLPLVAADYNCSRNSTVIELFMFDFLRNFQLTAATVRKKTFDDPNHRMNITMSSKDTHRNVTIWSECNLNTTQRQLCVVRHHPHMHGNFSQRVQIKSISFLVIVSNFRPGNQCIRPSASLNPKL